MRQEKANLMVFETVTETDLGENKAPSPQGAVEIYRWNDTLSFNLNFALPLCSNRLLALPGGLDIKF